jgi:hypothetical protein
MTEEDIRDITSYLVALEQLPMCVVCQAPVRSLYVTQLDGPTRLIIFAAYCHGDVEIVSFDADEWASVTPGTAEFGWAFNDPSPVETGLWPITNED